MEYYTEEEKLLIEYLKEIGCPIVNGLFILSILDEEKYVFEMLQYIAETEETDYEKLEAVAREIAGYEEPTELELKWNRMWVLWMNNKLESPYQEALNYENEVRNESHLEYFKWFEENSDIEKEISMTKQVFQNTRIEEIIKTAYNAYLSLKKNDTDEEARKILAHCDEMFAECEDKIEKVLESIAETIVL